MPEPQQDYANHGRTDPWFHRFLVPVSALTIIVAVVNVFLHPGFNSVWLVLVSVAAGVALFKMRLYSLKVQDRIIRLEERLRLQQLLSEPLRAQIDELTVGQLVALRFACDTELPALTARALNERLSKKELKEAVTSWRPDHLRV